MNLSKGFGFVVGIRVSPNYLVPEIVLTEYLIEDDFCVMRLLLIQMQVDASIVSEKLANKYKTASQKFDEARTSDSILVGTLFLFTREVAFSSKRRIDINNPRAWCRISVAKSARPFQLQQALHYLKVVAKD